MQVKLHHSVSKLVDLSHERVCGHCGQTFRVMFCPYLNVNLTFSSETTFDGKRHLEKYARSAADRKLLYRHRCTWCGHYDPVSISVMEMQYDRYRKLAWRSLLMNRLPALVLFLGGGLWLLSCLLFYGSIMEASRAVYDFRTWIVPACAVGFVFRLMLPVSRKQWTREVRAANSPETVEKWLELWHTHAPELLKGPGHKRLPRWWVGWGVQDPSRVQMYNNSEWASRLEMIQHQFDPPHLKKASYNPCTNSEGAFEAIPGLCNE